MTSTNAELDVTTMNLIGKPRVSRMKISELQPHKGMKFGGIANVARETAKVNPKRP